MKFEITISSFEDATRSDDIVDNFKWIVETKENDYVTVQHGWTETRQAAIIQAELWSDSYFKHKKEQAKRFQTYTYEPEA